MKLPRTDWLLRILILALLVGCLSGVNFQIQAQGRYNSARDLVVRTQEDLRRAAEFVRNKKEERERVENVQKHLSDFDRSLTKNKFDKDKLNDAIDDLKNLLDHNTLAGEDRDALTRDLQDLRTIRAHHD